MTKLYVDLYNSNGISNYAIYDDGDKNHMPCTENWQPLLYM